LPSKTYKTYNSAMTKVDMIPLRVAAERLGVHENTVRNWIDRGVIVGLRLPSGTRRLPAAEVERLEREMFAMPTSFAAEVVVAAPKPVTEEEIPPAGYPDL
jgi:excisionase family DNA binding protein